MVDALTSGQSEGIVAPEGETGEITEAVEVRSLLQKDIETLTDDERRNIVQYQRDQRAKFLAAEQSKADKAAKRKQKKEEG